MIGAICKEDKHLGLFLGSYKTSKLHNTEVARLQIRINAGKFYLN